MEVKPEGVGGGKAPHGEWPPFDSAIHKGDR